jgi:hypothetical protein
MVSVILKCISRCDRLERPLLRGVRGVWRLWKIKVQVKPQSDTPLAPRQLAVRVRAAAVAFIVG